MLIYDLGDGMMSALPIEDDPSPWYSVGDGDGDLIEDVWLHRSDGNVQVVHYEGSPLVGASYPRTVVYRGTPGGGPIDIQDIDGDGHNDLWIATPTLWWGTRGRGIPYDAERFWEPEGPYDTFVREGLNGPFRFAELDGSAATLEIVASTKDGSEIDLSLMQFSYDDERAYRATRTVLSGNELVDLAVCGTTAWALTNNALHTVSLADISHITVTGQVSVTDPRDVVCGSGPGGAAATVAANGEIISYNGSLSELNRTTAEAYGIAYGNLDGNGVQVQACVTEGCAVVPWTLDSGTTGLLVVDPDSALWVDAAGTASPLSGFGDSVQLFDVDGDGIVEAVSHDRTTGVVGIFRQVGGRIAPAHLWQSASPWSSGIGLHDGDLDGDIDLWGYDVAGALRYTHEERDVTTPPATGTDDTGDTGVPTSTSETGETGDTGTGTGS